MSGSRFGFDTLRWRILLGFGGVILGLLVAATIGVAALSAMRAAVSQELEALETSSQVGTGIVTSVFTEIRSADQYLTQPAPEAKQAFQSAADDAFQFEKGLEKLTGLTVEDRLTVNRVKQLQASIQVDYSLAHALRDLGHTADATAQAAKIRGPAAELTQLVGSLDSRQAERSVQAAARLSDLSRRRGLLLWLVLVVTVIGATVIALFTLAAVEGPLRRLVTAAERFGAGDLRPVTIGQMPSEFEVLAHAMQAMGERLRGIVGEVVAEADRIATSAGDLSAVSEELAASSAQVSTAMVEISGGAEQQRND
ncbi:MAG TPA: methyl-accepting chemotaxis protein, partial [Gemmatimonadales bacterium]